MAEYRLKPGKVGEKVIGAYEKVEKKFTDAFLEEDAVSDSGYRLKRCGCPASRASACPIILYACWRHSPALQEWNRILFKIKNKI